MSKVTLTNLVNLTNQTTAVNAINANNAVLTTAMDNTLSRDGTQPNQMNATLDMNSNRMINLPSATSTTEPVTLSQMTGALVNNGNIVTGLTGVPVSAAMQPVVNASTTASALTLIGGVNATAITTISVLDFGAIGNGVADDTAAIQSAINALPTSGGIVLFPSNKNFKISSVLVIGNGTSTTLSTRQGVILRGTGNPNTPIGLPSLNGYSLTTGPKLTWASGAGSMIAINGPLQGWGIQNLLLDGSGVPGVTGITVTSGQFGDCSNLTIQGCGTTSIYSTSYPIGGFTGIGNVDSLRNNWLNTFILVPAIVGAKGIFLHGDPGGTTDTDYNIFTNTFIRSTGSTNFGVYLGVNDANTFVNLSCSMGTGTGMYFDYTLNSNFPSSTNVYAYEINSFGSTGTPGVLATPNNFYGAITANQAPLPSLVNTVVFSRGQITGTITGDNATAGNIGEYISSNVASPGISLATNVNANLTTLVVRAGDWDVWLDSYFIPGATTNLTNLISSISSVSGVINNANGSFSQLPFPGTVLGSTNITVITGPTRVNFTAPTTLYAVVQGQFTVSTLSSYGIIRARRIR